jgi:hypothetical protein
MARSCETHLKIRDHLERFRTVVMLGTSTTSNSMSESSDENAEGGGSVTSESSNGICVYCME